jgi:hypothetical protein
MQAAMHRVSSGTPPLRVVGRADPVERPVVRVLVAIDLLPVARDRSRQRILIGIGGRQQPERQHELRGGGRPGADTEPAEEFPAFHPTHGGLSPVGRHGSITRSCQIVTDFFPSRSPALPFHTANPTGTVVPGRNVTARSPLPARSRRNITRYVPVA